MECEPESAQRDVNQLLIDLTPLVQKIVRGHVRRQLRQWPEFLTEEIEQNILVGLWPRIEKYDPSRGPIEPFAAKVIGNLLRDELRNLRKARPGFILLPEEIATHDDDLEQSQIAERIQDRPGDYLPPFLLRIYHALQTHQTPAAAAQSLGMKPKTFHDLTGQLKTRLKNLFHSRSTPPLRNAA
jgi:DNA-directed RNA polymerase specialized sigma24 family protein